MSLASMILCACGACAGLGAGCARHPADAAGPVDGALTRPAVTDAAAPRPVEVAIAMHDVHLHLTDGIALDVADLQGMMTSRKAGTPPIFDDPRSYVLRLTTADLTMDMASLTNLMNQQVFGYDGAPLSRLTVAVASDGRLAMHGKLHKGISVPFSGKATVGATEDGRLRLHLDSMKAVGVPVKGLMDVLGLELDDVISLKKNRGVSLENDDLFVTPGTALPPPEIRGRIARVATAGQRLQLVFGPPSGRATKGTASNARAENYVSFGGGTIRFGKLTMTDADLRLIDADPRDPFDFFPARYQRQLVAGYSKNTPAGGLRTLMPDYDDLTRRQAMDLRPPRKRTQVLPAAQKRP
jgi:hypothetical protein